MNTFYYHFYKSYRTLRALFGAKYEIVQVSRDYRDNFAVINRKQLLDFKINWD